MAASLAELLRKKGMLITKLKDLVEKEDELEDGSALSDEDKASFDDFKTQLTALNERIGRLEDVLAAQADAAEGVGEDADPDADSGTTITDETVQTGHRAGVRRGGLRMSGESKAPLAKGLFVAAAAKMMALTRNPLHLGETSRSIYGERHAVTEAIVKRTLTAGIGPNGGFVVPPDYVREIIELLRATCVVRASGPRTMPMPNGTMTLPKQTQAATASYSGEITPIPVSQEALGQIVASYKTLTALVPISNDLLRYSDPEMDAFVRDDLVQVSARAEDLAFIRGDGTQGAPKGFRTFAAFGNFISSNPAFTYQTPAIELGGALNKLETGNVPMVNPVWIMNPRPKNYLMTVQNAVGAYVYRDEMLKGTLYGIPFRTTTQIPANLAFVSGGTPYVDGSEIYLAEMSQALLLDSLVLELAASNEASYVDATGATQNTFQSRQTLIRSVSQHDFQMRHDEAVVVIQNVRWAPAIQ